MKIYEEKIDISSRTESKDIYSHSNHGDKDIYSSSKRSKKQPKVRRKRPFLKVLAVFLCIVLVFTTAVYVYTFSLLNKIERTELDENNLGITTNNYSGVVNIAIFGLDSRSDTYSGRADANIILTIDKRNRKIKLTTIARDTYVAIEGHGNSKLTHAYAYGQAQLAVNTLNTNFDLEITDYVTMNFFGLARVIDYLGGVELDVSDSELYDLNTNVIPKTDFGDGITCEKLEKTGLQTLSGAQAVCYARIRKVDSDLERGNRQKELIVAIFNKVKKMNIAKLPELATMILEECSTSLSSNELIGLAAWTLLSAPDFEQLSIPNDNISSSGKTINGGWYYVYDLETAKQEIYDFIKEKNYYSKAEKKKRAES